MAEKTKEAASQPEEAAEERSRLLFEIDKVKGEMVQKDEDLAKDIKVCK